MAHGFELEPELHAALRSSVPAAAVTWVESVCGRAVVDVVALEGGVSSAVHRVTLEGGGAVVLRRYVLDWIHEEPWLQGNEARVLRLLETSAVPAPRLLAADSDGAATGTPSVLMTALEGEVVWNPDDLNAWLDALVQTVVAIHEVPVTGNLLAWKPYAPEGTPQRWSRNPDAWARAVEAFNGPGPARRLVFIHRDFHPGNVLWTAGRVTGVVDWVGSCAGPAEEDIAHCRVNLVRSHGQGVADEFLERWLSVSERDNYDPYYDLVTAVSMAGAPDSALDTFVDAAARAWDGPGGSIGGDADSS